MIRIIFCLKKKKKIFYLIARSLETGSPGLEEGLNGHLGPRVSPSVCRHLSSCLSPHDHKRATALTTIVFESQTGKSLKDKKKNLFLEKYYLFILEGSFS